MTRIYSEWAGWLGVVVGSLSAISAVTHIYAVGLGAFLLEMLQYYRDLVQPISEALKAVGLSLTPIQADLLLLYLVLFMMSLRAATFPMLQPEVMDHERNVSAKTYVVKLPEKPQEYPENMIHGTEGPDGFVATCAIYKPTWFFIGRSILASLLLLPVLTFLPFRRLARYSRNERSFVRLAWTSKELDDTKGFIKDGENSFVSSSYLRTIRTYIWVAIQTIALPMFVVIFFVLAKFGPLS